MTITDSDIRVRTVVEKQRLGQQGLGTGGEDAGRRYQAPKGSLSLPKEDLGETGQIRQAESGNSRLGTRLDLSNSLAAQNFRSQEGRVSADQRQFTYFT